MQTPLFRLAALMAFCALASAVLAGDPAGNWKWLQKEPGAGGRTARETLLTLELIDKKLTGTITMPGRGTLMESKPIVDAWFMDDVITFTVERDINAVKVITKYRGKITGDFINGTMDGLGRDGLSLSRPWTARRAR